MDKLTPEETARSYDALADHWNGDEFHRANGIAQHERAIRFSKKSGRALDVGCGSSGRIIDLLQEHGFAVEGLDISEKMLAHARSRHPDVEFHQADIVSWEFPGAYEFISAWDSIWHVPLEQQESVLRKLCAGLADGGVLITSSGGIDEASEGSNPFKGQPLYHAALGIPKILRVIDECGCICRHLEYDEAHGEEVGRHLTVIVQRGNIC